MAGDGRRTQRERSEATRAQLLDAALECLVDYGYGGLTTTLVCERAQVSRGAYLHHFGSRAALVAAALAELAERRERQFETDVEELTDGARRAIAGLDLLWSWFTGPLFYASVDLGVAARTDADLRASLMPVEHRLGRTTLLLCRRIFAAGESDGSRDEEIQMALGTVRGLALLPVLQPGSRRAGQQWPPIRRRLATILAEPRPGRSAVRAAEGRKHLRGDP